jgi:pyruvate-formate lyase-activating enzyme
MNNQVEYRTMTQKKSKLDEELGRFDFDAIAKEVEGDMTDKMLALADSLKQLAGGNVAIALLANTLATGAMLARTPLIPEVNDSEENIRATLEWRNY